MDGEEWQVLRLTLVDQGHPLIAGISEDLVCARTHHLDQLFLAREIDGLRSIVRLSITSAIPIEIGTAFTPSHTAILSYDGDSELVIPNFPFLEGTTERELPTDIGLGFVEVGALSHCEVMECATHPTFKSSSIEEDTRAVDAFGLAILVESDFGDIQLPTSIGT